MSTNKNTNSAATIVASIDVATVAGHNLRALLLRVLLEGGEAWRGESGSHEVALADADALDLVDIDVSLTPLGREVAERLRPEPWHVDGEGSSWTLRGEGRIVRLNFATRSFVGRIASLLTADDLRAAKTYKTESDA